MPRQVKRAMNRQAPHLRIEPDSKLGSLLAGTVQADINLTFQRLFFQRERNDIGMVIMAKMCSVHFQKSIIAYQYHIDMGIAHTFPAESPFHRCGDFRSTKTGTRMCVYDIDSIAHVPMT